MKIIGAVLILLALSTAGFAQTGETESEDFDGLFEGDLVEEGGGAQQGVGAQQGGSGAQGEASGEADLFEEDIFEEAETEEGGGEGESAPEEAFLVSERLEWGGRFECSFDGLWSWDGYPDSWGALFTEASPQLTTGLKGELFFDARPSRDFRVFGKAKASYEYDPLAVEDSWGWNAEIFELFSDFQYGDLLFFRAGKQTVQWGVGYFFSPADVLSLVSIDPEDPELEREGPIALKVHYPFAVHNAYLYLVANRITRPDEIAVAPKVELLLGSYELGLWAFYQKDLAPKGVMTLTGPLWRLDLFAEALVQWRSDRRFVRPAGPAYETYTIDDELLFSASAGFSYLNPDWNLSIFGQYLFNGQGYREDFDPTSTAVLTALAAEAIGPADLLLPGRHYLAASAGWSEILGSPVSLSLLWLANLSDGSGLLTPGVSWELFERFILSTGLRLGYGPARNEYSPTGASLAYTLGVSLGGGRF